MSEEESGEVLESGAETTKKEIAGLNRRNGELEKEIGELRATVSELSKQRVDTFEGLRDEIAEVKAMRGMVEKQSRMIDKALQFEIDPKLAVAFAETSDADATFELAIAEIERRAVSEVNKRLGQTPKPKGSPGESPGLPDLSRMSQREINRMPASLREQAFTHYLEGVSNE